MTKYYKIIFAVVLFISFTSCSDDDFEVDVENGIASCSIENNHTEFSTRVVRPPSEGRITISFTHFNSRGERRGDVTFSRILLTQEKHYFEEPTSGLDNNFASYTTSLADGDVLGEAYGILANNNQSWYHIDEYSETKKLLKGRFETIFYIPPGGEKQFPNSPDTINMTNGVFEINLE